MSRLSRCTRRYRNQALIPLRKVLWIFMWVTLWLGFGLGQLHLQFSVSDLEQETTRLQKIKMNLRNQLHQLRSEVQAHKQNEKLIDYAVNEFKMIKHSPGDVERIVMDPEIQRRYLAAEAKREREIALPVSPKAWTEALATRLGFDSSAIAGEER